MSHHSPEDPFRTALRWYPASWREQHGKEILGTLLDGAEASGRTAPTKAERLNLAAHGMRERMLSAERLLPASVRDRASAVSLGTGAMLSLVMLFAVEMPWSSVRASGDLSVYGWSAIRHFGLFASPAVIVYAAFFVAFVLAIVGFSRASRALLTSIVPLAVLVRIVGDAGEMWLRPAWTLMGFLILLAIVAMIGFPGRNRRTAGWTAIAAGAALVSFVLPFTSGTPDGFSAQKYFFDSWPIPGYLASIPVATLGLALLMGALGSKVWGLAVVVATLPWLALGTFGQSDPSDLIGPALIVIATAAAAYGALRLLRSFGITFEIKVAIHRDKMAGPA